MDHGQSVGVDQQLSSNAELFGVIAIDKPQGKTSRDIVNQVQRLIRPTKIGHTGTLDPMATGVLLLAIGKATRLMEFAHWQPKSYEADFILGKTSDTLDTDGQVQSIQDAPAITLADWEQQLPYWRGCIQQTPPQYSACRVDGRRAYDLARQGIEAKLASREVTIHHLEVLKFEYPLVTMTVRCSSGTYIRSLGADIAAALGTGAVMSRLIRTSIGDYSLQSCAKIEQVASLQDVTQLLQSPVGLVCQFPRVSVSDVECERLRTGSTLELNAYRSDLLKPDNQAGTQQSNHEPSSVAQPIVGVDADGQLVAMLEVRGDKLQPTRVFL